MQFRWITANKIVGIVFAHFRENKDKLQRTALQKMSYFLLTKVLE